MYEILKKFSQHIITDNLSIKNAMEKIDSLLPHLSGIMHFLYFKQLSYFFRARFATINTL